MRVETGCVTVASATAKQATVGGYYRGSAVRAGTEESCKGYGRRSPAAQVVRHTAGVGLSERTEQGNRGPGTVGAGVASRTQPHGAEES